MVHITSTSTWCLKKILSRKAKLYIAEYFRNPFIRFCFWKVTHYLYKAFFPKHHKDIYGMQQIYIHNMTSVKISIKNKQGDSKVPMEN